MSTTYSERKEITIETPFGIERLEALKWFEGTPDEHWGIVQDLNPYIAEDLGTGSVLQHFLTQYAIARELAERGYTVEERLDNTAMAWMKYTSED